MNFLTIEFNENSNYSFPVAAINYYTDALILTNVIYLKKKSYKSFNL